MVVEKKYVLKEKVIQPFNYAQWILWFFIPIVGIFIGYFMCSKKYILILESVQGEKYDIRRIDVLELDYYKANLNEVIIVDDRGLYWADKEKQYVKINTKN